MSPSLSALLADPSVDHSGSPIPVEYKTPGKTKASSNTMTAKTVSQDVAFIHHELAYAVAKWEQEHDNAYYHDQFPAHHGHAGLQGAKVVPIRLNLDELDSINSFAGEKALMNHDFVARRSNPMPSYLVPRYLARWRTSDSHRRPRSIFPAHYLVWKAVDSEGALYAQIPKPLEGLSRAASCDHCRIHDPTLVWQTVDYFDDRRHVNGIRQMRAVDTAATPFSLCRFHWWYVWSGELLRRSHVHALEMLVKGELFERWGISHTREFLESVEGWCSLLEDSNDLDPEVAWRCLPAGLLDKKDEDNDDDEEDDDDRVITNGRLPLEQTEAATPQGAESPSPPIVPQETVASTVEQPLVPADQPAGTTTADGSYDIGPVYQSYAERETDVLQRFVALEEPRLAELMASVNPATRTDPARREVFQLPARAFNRRVALMENRIRAYRELASAHTSGQETIELASQQTGTDQQSNGAPPSHVTRLVASNSMAPVAKPQGNGTAANKSNGLLYSPPTEPLAMRQKQPQQGEGMA